MLRSATVAIGCAACLLSTGQALGATPPPLPTVITVTGDGAVSATPDELQLDLEVDTQAGRVSAALQAANIAMSAVRAALLRDGVAATDLQTTGVSVSPSYGDKGTIIGYEVTESLTAELRDLKTAGSTITDAAGAGGNAIRIDGVTLDLNDQRAALEARARAAAVADAKLRASQYAMDSGLRIGQVLLISEPGNQQPLPAQPLGAAPSAANPVPISPGTLRVSQSVVVVYQTR